MRSRRPSKVSETVARQILDRVLSEGLGPCTRLPPEAVMLEEYGVGRSSLREALRILEVYGLLEIRTGKGGGPVIQHVGPRDFARLMTFYLELKGVTFGELMASSRIIQSAMVARAATFRDAGQIARMRAALQRAEAADDDVGFGAALYDFHHTTYEVPGGEVLALIRDALHEIVILRIRRHIPYGEVRQNLTDHYRLVDAIEAGDVAAAQRIAESHAEKTDVLYRRSVRGLFAERVPWV